MCAQAVSEQELLMSSSTTYSHEMIIRDVVYYLHECAEYHSIAYDLDWTPLLGPYWAYLADEDPLARHGTTLILIGMLREWLSHAGFPFGTSPDGICSHSFPAYLAHLIAAYEQPKPVSDPAIRRLYEVALSLCVRLQREGLLTQHIADLSPDLLAWLAAYGAREDQDPSATDWPSAYTELYEAFVQPCFALRST
jgi:hypothetical protein